MCVLYCNVLKLPLEMYLFPSLSFPASLPLAIDVFVPGKQGLVSIVGVVLVTSGPI